MANQEKIFELFGADRTCIERFLPECAGKLTAALGVAMEDGLPIRFCNGRFAKILGYENEEALLRETGGSIARLLRAEEAGPPERNFQCGTARPGQEFDVTHRIQKRNGGILWLRMRGKMLRGEQALLAVGCCTDVTEEKTLENQLYLYRRATAGGAFLVRMDGDFTLLYGNDIYYAIHEYTEESMKERIGNRCREYVHPDDLPMVQKTIGEALEAGKASVEWEMRVVTGLGNIRWVKAWGAFEFHGAQLTMNGFVLENTENHRRGEEQADRERRERQALSEEVCYRERLFDALSRDVDTAYILFAGDTDVLPQYVSPNLERLLGITREELGDRLEGLFAALDPEGEARWRAELRAWSRDALYHRELCFLNAKTGEKHWMDTELRKLDLSGGGVLLSLDDRTRERESAQKLSAALKEAQEANRAKSVFLSSMSHDIRTPMNGILGMTGIARQHLNDPGRVADCLEKIEISAQHLRGLINDILDLSRIESGKLVLGKEPFAFSDWMKKIAIILEPQIEEKSQKFVLDCAGVRHNDLIGDPVRLSQVLINILGNAAKFTPEGGEIRLCARELPQPQPDIARMQIEVQDTGIGMSPEFQAKMFEAFTQERTVGEHTGTGTGLGMAITKDIVEQMGGEIRVKSAPGEGTTVTLVLGLLLGSKTEVPKASNQLKNRCEGRRLLLAEDNALNREIAVEILRASGVEVFTAVNGQAAADRFAASPEGFFDAILMDIQMPVMNGYEAARHIRADAHPQAKTIPILALTANAFRDDISAALAAGMDAHVSKPIDPAALFAALERVWQRERAGNPKSGETD